MIYFKEWFKMQTKRKKRSRIRAAKPTSGHGHKKKNRGAGHRGGRGRAGSGKRGSTNLMQLTTGKDFLGKHGFTSIKKKHKIINLAEIQKSLESLLEKGLITKVKDVYELDLIKLGYDKLLSNGYIFRQIDADILICSCNKNKFLLVFSERVTKQNIKSLVENYKFNNYIIIVGYTISQDIKDYLGRFNNITIFDLSSKKYRKIQSDGETIIKKLLYDRFARFTKEIY